jgi:hypothetical protein
MQIPIIGQSLYFLQLPKIRLQRTIPQTIAHQRRRENGMSR